MILLYAPMSVLTLKGLVSIGLTGQVLFSKTELYLNYGLKVLTARSQCNGQTQVWRHRLTKQCHINKNKEILQIILFFTII